MNNNRKLLMTLIGGVVMMTLILIGLATTAARADTSAESLRIDMTAYGKAELLWTAIGEYDEVVTPPTTTEPEVLNDLGEIALGFWLQDQSVSDDVVFGYVDLLNTLVFTTEYAVDTTTPSTTTVTTQDGGPAVSGTFDGTNFTLLSERFALTTQTGKTVERQFRLIGTVSDNQIVGEYRETIWGYSLETVTIGGDFALTLVAAPTAVPTAVTGLGISANAPTTAVMLVTLVLLLVGVTVVSRRKTKDSAAMMGSR